MPLFPLNGTQNLYFEEIDGDPGRPHLVFLHEGLGCGAMWKDFPRRLCAETGFPGILHDRLGYGKSSPAVEKRTINYLHKYALIELPALLAHLIPGRDHFLIGHSDGGSIALIAGADNPPGLKGIITAAAHVCVEEKSIQGIHAAVKAWEAGKLGALRKYHGDKTEAVFRAWSEAWLTPSFRHWNIEHLLPSIACPLLVMQGSADQYGSPCQVERIASKAPNARPAILEGCGHSPHLDQPDATLALMKEFILG